MRRRRDGYHDIASLFTAIDLCDQITCEHALKDSFETDYKPLLSDSSNSLIKARDLFRQEVNIEEKVALTLKKVIPSQAGLGGGSSNAATTLFALNELFDRPLSNEALISMASSIGSDVPFFLSQGLTYCEGRGEIMRFIDLPFERQYWLVKPDHLHLATPLVYKECVPGEVSSEDPEYLLESVLSSNQGYVNDLEAAAYRILPELAEVKKVLLDKGFNRVTMTGSGTAFFCEGSTIEMPKLEGLSFYKVRTIKRNQGEWY